MATAWKIIRVEDAVYEKSIPLTPACYCIYIDGVLKYVGQTNNLKRRISCHFSESYYSTNIKTPWGLFGCGSITIKYKGFKKYGEWAMCELRLIKRLQPIFNLMHRSAVANG